MSTSNDTLTGPILPLILKIGGGLLLGMGSILMHSITDKLVMRLVLVALGRLVKSTKNDLDDELFAPIKDAIQKELDK